MMCDGIRLKIAPVRSCARATRPEQICWPSTANVNFPPVNRLYAMLRIVSQPYGCFSDQRANATACSRSSGDASMRTTWYSVGS
jgi:hypothetical protein